MISAELSHNPYLLNTTVKFNGQTPKINSQIEKYVKLPLKDWAHLVPEIFYNEMNGYDFNLYFTGTKPDFEEIKKAFIVKGVSEKLVRLFHKKEIEDADTKSKEIDELIKWLKNNPNPRFDFEMFWKEEAFLFENTYSYIMVRGALPLKTDPLLSIERVESVTELNNTDLTSTPIVFNIDEETKSKFRIDLSTVVKRQDVKKEQLFFKISPVMNQAQVTRVISDLGVEKPQVIENYYDEPVMRFVRNYPITEFVRSAIQLFNGEIKEISKTLEAENQESVVANAEIHKKIEALNEALQSLKAADDFFIQPDVIEAPSDFKEIQNSSVDKIDKWKKRKTKITGESEIEAAATEFSNYTRNINDSFMSAIQKIYNEVGYSISKELAIIYSNPGIDEDYRPDNIVLPQVTEIEFPEIEKTLLKATKYEEIKKDVFGIFKKSNELSEPVMVVTCSLRDWKDITREMVFSITENYINQCVRTLSEYYTLLAEDYHRHLTQLIDEKSVEIDKVEAQLSDDERKLQADNTWLDTFKEQLHKIERD